MGIPVSKAYRGVPFENLLLITGEEYWRRRIAFIEKNEVATGFNKQRRKMFFKKKKGCDFFGAHWVKGLNDGAPVPLFIEAKDINEESLRLLQPWAKPGTGSGVKYHQLQYLVTLQRAWCECWILWRTGGKVYRISPLWALEHYGPGKSIPADDTLVLVPQKHHFIDFLFRM